MPEISGFHHVTAICGPAQETLDFYSGVLGLRLIKLTVNYDDPTAHHLYFGDPIGTPGTILTFFPYPDARPGRPGRGHINATSLAISKDASSFWIDRLRDHDVEMDKPQSREGHQVIGFRAPDGLCLELIASNGIHPPHDYNHPQIAPHRAIGPIQAVTIAVDDLEPTERLLTQIMGFEKISERDNRHGYSSGSSVVDLVVSRSGPRGRTGHGSIHHVAFLVSSDEAQAEFRDQLLAEQYPVSNVMDRTYFKSIYFREPNGSVFEIATKGPGFQVDESARELGKSLQLPPQFQDKRIQIERLLKPLELP
jgi:glyoxalase family protein